MKSDKILKIIIIILLVMCLGVGIFISVLLVKGDLKVVDENSVIETSVKSNGEEENETNNNTIEKGNSKNEIKNTTAESSISNTKQGLTKEETAKIEAFVKENSSFSFINYNNPDDFVKHIGDENSEEFCDEPAIRIIQYTLQQYRYTNEATNEQAKNTEFFDVPVSLISEDNLIRFFKDKINYTYSKENLRKDFKDWYNEKLGCYAFSVSDALTNENFELKNAYTIDNKYYLTFESPNILSDEGKDEINLVIIKNNGAYQFYSCNNSSIK